MKLKVYWKYWSTSAKLSVQTALENRTSAIFFLSAKFIRFLLFLAFLVLIYSQVQAVAEYTLQQMVIFFLIFTLFDLFGQIFFRGIYWFRQQVISGEFDFRLTKPLSALFQALTRQTDVLDIPLLILVIIMLLRQDIFVSLSSLVAFALMFIVGCIIITAIHIIVASLGIITTEVDHTIMIYRDLSSMARFPIDIYISSIRSILTFVIPIAIAYTFPAKALMGLLSPLTIILSLLASALILFISLKFWQYALTKYSSASS